MFLEAILVSADRDRTSNILVLSMFMKAPNAKKENICEPAIREVRVRPGETVVTTRDERLNSVLRDNRPHCFDHVSVAQIILASAFALHVL